MPETQASAVVRKLRSSRTTGSRTAAKKSDAPTVIIPSALELTRPQEEALLAHAKSRHETLTNDLGRLDYSQPNWVAAARGLSHSGYGIPFFAQRFLAHLVYHGRMEFRPAFYGGIWNETNLHLPLVRRIVQQQIARATAYFFGTSPWFSAQPVGRGDNLFADKVDHWSKFCANEAGLSDALSEAIHLAFIQGEQYVETIHDVQVSYYETFAIIGLKADGQPFIAMDGDYVYQHDRFEPPPAPIDPATGQPVPIDPATQPKVLQRDGQTPFPGNLNFVRQKIRKRIQHFSGARATCPHYMDILCPLNAPDVQRADIVQKLSSEPVIGLINRLVRSSPQWGAYAGLSPQQQFERIAELAERILPGSGEELRPAANSPRAELNESQQQQGTDNLEPEIATATSWMHYSANPNGMLANMVLISDREFKVPIYYGYAGEVTHHGRRPLRVVRINPVPGRWHGQGQVETFYQLQHNADLMLNRWNYSQMSCARVDLWSPQLTVEGEKNTALKMNWGKTYTKRDPKTPAADILESVYLREIKGTDLNAILQLIMQMTTNMGAVANANDSRMAGLDTAELATGVKNIEQSGQELFGKYISELSPDIKGTVEDFLGLTMAHIDGPRVFRFFEYDPNAAQMVMRVASMTPGEIQNLALDISLELTRYRAQTDGAQGEAAWKVGTEYYTAAPLVQQRLRSLAIQRLKALQIKDADTIIEPVPMVTTLPDGTMAPAGADGLPAALPAPAAAPTPPPAPPSPAEHNAL